MVEQEKARKNPFYTIAFILLCGGILFFLWRAPEESTSRLPHDKNHEHFFAMEKKEAEKFCGECHGEDKLVPFPEDHPPKYRCLLCHKRDQEPTKK